MAWSQSLAQAVFVRLPPSPLHAPHRHGAMARRHLHKLPPSCGISRADVPPSIAHGGGSL